MTTPDRELTEARETGGGKPTLIERLEAASGPDRELDREILRHLGFTWRGMNYWHHNGKTMWTGPTFFTASIDAALTLVPEGAHVSAQFDTPEPGCDTAASIVLSYGEATLGAGLATKPAIALCIAALKARGLP